jgi:chemotaxis protein histidine kinase CheA
MPDDENPEEREARALAATGSALENQARAIVIKDNVSYEAAAAFKLAIKSKRDEIMGGEQGPLAKKKAANGVWKWLSNLCDMIQKPFDDAESVVDQKMLAYRREVESKRQEEARKANEKAQAQAKKKRDAEIARAKELGDKEAARNLKAAPLHVEAVAPKTPEAPKIVGAPARKIWKFRVDVDKLDRKYLIADEVTIGKLVRALGAAHGISGVTAWQEETI